MDHVTETIRKGMAAMTNDDWRDAANFVVTYQHCIRLSRPKTALHRRRLSYWRRQHQRWVARVRPFDTTN